MTGFYNVEAQDHCDIPIAYKGTFKVTDDRAASTLSAVGNVTFKYSSTEADMRLPRSTDSGQPPLLLLPGQRPGDVDGSLVYQGTDHCNYFPHEAQFSYANDEGRHGGIDITLRSPDPSYSNIYCLWFGSNAKTMEVDTTDVFPTM